MTHLIHTSSFAVSGFVAPRSLEQAYYQRYCQRRGFGQYDAPYDDKILQGKGPSTPGELRQLDRFQRIRGEVPSFVARRGRGITATSMHDVLPSTVEFPPLMKILLDVIMPIWENTGHKDIAPIPKIERRYLEMQDKRISRGEISMQRALQNGEYVPYDVWKPGMDLENVSEPALLAASKRLAEYGGEVRIPHMDSQSCFNFACGRPLLYLTTFDAATIAHEMDHFTLWVELTERLERQGMTSKRARREAMFLIRSSSGIFVSESRAVGVEERVKLSQALRTNPDEREWPLDFNELMARAAYPYRSELMKQIEILFGLGMNIKQAILHTVIPTWNKEFRLYYDSFNATADKILNRVAPIRDQVYAAEMAQPSLIPDGSNFETVENYQRRLHQLRGEGVVDAIFGWPGPLLFMMGGNSPEVVAYSLLMKRYEALVAEGVIREPIF